MNKIKTVHDGQLFFHPKSVEPSTQITKPKLKLLIASITHLDLYIFIPGTSKSYTSGSISSIQLNYNDWEMINSDFNNMLKTTGYYSINKCCNHLLDDIWNNFIYVAKLKHFKFSELFIMCERTTKYVNKFDKKGTILAKIAVTPLTEVEDTINKLGI